MFLYGTELVLYYSIFNCRWSYNLYFSCTPFENRIQQHTIIYIILYCVRYNNIIFSVLYSQILHFFFFWYFKLVFDALVLYTGMGKQSKSRVCIIFDLRAHKYCNSRVCSRCTYTYISHWLSLHSTSFSAVRYCFEIRIQTR